MSMCSIWQTGYRIIEGTGQIFVMMAQSRSARQWKNYPLQQSHWLKMCRMSMQNHWKWEMRLRISMEMYRFSVTIPITWIKQTKTQRKSIETVLDSSNRSSAIVEKITNQIEETNQAISSINEAVDLIMDITGQTSLLSLNASIEAARAGQAGRRLCRCCR